MPEPMTPIEMDVAIAQHFFGYTLDYSHRYWATVERPSVDELEDRKSGPIILPHYCEDISSAWTVVEKLRKSGYLVNVQEMPDGIPWLANRIDESDCPIFQKVYVSLKYIRGRTSTDVAEVRRYIHEHIHATAETAAMAICMAAIDSLTDDQEQVRAKPTEEVLDALIDAIRKN